MKFSKSTKIFLVLAVVSIVLSGLYLSISDSSPSGKLELEITSIFPHDPEAFTQGLIYHDGIFYESTGLYGKSSLRKVDPRSGKVLKKLELPENYFAEGITIIGDRIYQLTWKSGKGFIYNKNDFSPLGTFYYKTEGWGLTTDGKNLIMSDGTSQIYFMETDNFTILRTLNVTYNNSPVSNINELEYAEGMIYANIWQSNYIVAIDPGNGNVKKLIDLDEVLGKHMLRDNVKVPNGIAYREKPRTFYVTGKLWPDLFELQFR